MFRKTLIAHFFTTIDFKIALRSFLILFRPYFWFNLVDGKYIKICEEKLLFYLGLENSKIISFYNARSAIYNCLKIIGIKNQDEILVQSYTCVSVCNAIIQSGGIPVYIDIDETLNLDFNLIEKPINSNTKALIIQHTFGNPANVEKFKEICSKNNLILIEDCAHSLGSEINNKKVGTFGDFSIFSTGRDKVISAVTGGFLVVNNKNYFDKLDLKLDNINKILALKNIFYNLVAYKSYKFYDFFGLGKVIIFLARKLNIITQILTKEEKNCNFKLLNYKLPNCLAYLGIFEIEKIDFYNEHRRKIAEIYKKELTNLENIKLVKELENTKNNYFGFPINTNFAKELIDFCKKENILLGNYWNGEVIIPLGTDLEKANYKAGSCQNAEKLCKNILTLPTHNLITEKDFKKIIEVLKKFKI